MRDQLFSFRIQMGDGQSSSSKGRHPSNAEAIEWAAARLQTISWILGTTGMVIVALGVAEPQWIGGARVETNGQLTIVG